MKIRPEVVRFLAAQERLTLAESERRRVDLLYRQADADTRRAWDALTPSEAKAVTVVPDHRPGNEEGAT